MEREEEFDKAIERGKELQRKMETGEIDRKNILDRRFGDHPILVEHERRSGRDRREKPPTIGQKLKKMKSANPKTV